MNHHDNYTEEQAKDDALTFAFTWSGGAVPEGPYNNTLNMAYAYAMEDTNAKPIYPPARQF